MKSRWKKSALIITVLVKLSSTLPDFALAWPFYSHMINESWSQRLHANIHLNSTSSSHLSPHVHLNVHVYSCWLVHWVVHWCWTWANVHRIRVDVHVHSHIHRIHTETRHLKVNSWHNFWLPIWGWIEVIVERNEGVYEDWLLDNREIWTAGTDSWETCFNNKIVDWMKSVSSSCWLDIFRVTSWGCIDNLDNILSLPLLSWS